MLLRRLHVLYSAIHCYAYYWLITKFCLKSRRWGTTYGKGKHMITPQIWSYTRTIYSALKLMVPGDHMELPQYYGGRSQGEIPTDSTSKSCDSNIHTWIYTSWIKILRFITHLGQDYRLLYKRKCISASAEVAWWSVLFICIAASSIHGGTHLLRSWYIEYNTHRNQ